MIDALLLVGLVGDGADAQAELLVDRPHLVGVALDQVIVDGQDVHRAPVPGPDRGGQGRGQRLAFAGRHLGDVAVDHGERAHELHLERAHGDGANRRLARQGQAAL